MLNPPPLFVLGTGQRVGKTLIATGLLTAMGERGLAAVGMKPVETGCPHDDDHDLVGVDGEQLRAAAPTPLPPLVASPYRFAHQLSPLRAAERAGLELGLDDLVQAVEAAAKFARTIVEGPGGPLCPVARGAASVDLAVALGAAVLVVGSDRQGADSDVLLTLEACAHRKADVRGVLLSRRHADATAQFQEQTIRERGGVPVFETLPTLQAGDTDTVPSHLEAHGVLDALLRR